MGLNPNTRWPSTTRSRRRASGRETQYQWPSEERILSQAITAPVFDFAEVFGPSTEFADWGLALVISVRNKGQLDIVIESVALHWQLAEAAAPAVFLPPTDPQAHPLPYRVPDGAAGHWPIAASNVRGNVLALQNATVVSVRGVVTLSSGERFESGPMPFDELVRGGFGIT